MGQYQKIAILSQTGVVSGEYGFVEAYKHKKSDLQHWKKVKDKKISAFVKEYEDYLDSQIVYEKKKADEGIELRKRGIQ